MNDELFRVVLHQVINEGRLETFKEMGERLVAANKGNEPDTLTYEYYVNEAGTDGWVGSTCANSEALLLHYVHSREMRFEMPDIGPIVDVHVFGSPNAEARKELDWLKPTYVPLFAGCIR